LKKDCSLEALAPMTDGELAEYRLHRRFDRMARLVGDRPMKTLLRSHVLIAGLGGVGSWAAEAVVRSGVGRVTVIDFDAVCVTNANRQLHALDETVGRPKAEVMAERLRRINPRAEIRAEARFIDQGACAELLGDKPGYVIDAIDSVASKCQLLAYCKTQGIPVVTSTGSGGRLDPTRVRVADLSKTESDPLARDIRRILREKHGFPKKEGAAFGIPAVFSAEPHRKPKELHYDHGKGFRCVCPQKDNPFFNCDERNLIYGNAGFVTGAFGLAAASVAVRGLLGEPIA
jgi:tRNA A37 threonylcarbamoyladenosine dehydratase